MNAFSLARCSLSHRSQAKCHIIHIHVPFKTRVCNRNSSLAGGLEKTLPIYGGLDFPWEAGRAEGRAKCAAESLWFACHVCVSCSPVRTHIKTQRPLCVCDRKLNLTSHDCVYLSKIEFCAS
jgi:hypothetical protein